MPIILIIALLLGGGTTFAASSSLPGDMLYPVKINVNENVSSLFSFGAESEAKFHAEEVSTRLEEAEKLAAEGKLSAEVQADLKASIEAHAKAVHDRIAELQAKGDTEAAAEVSAGYENSLKARQTALLKIQSQRSDLKATLETVLNRVNTEIDTAAKVRATSSSTASPTNTSGETRLNGSVDVTSGADTDTRVRGTDTGAGIKANGSLKVDLGI